MKAAESKELKKARYEWLTAIIGLYKKDMAERLAETHKIFGRPVLAVEIHTHSNYSDGCGTVEENYECFKRAGLDFIFITDHNSLGQKRIVRRWPDASWGQEPGAGPHHIGLLCNRRRFRPRCDGIAADFERAKKLAPFVWIPHPAGWYPRTWYNEEQIATLWSLGETFAVEVMNGACKIFRAYDDFDEKAVAVWDRLLCDGRKVTALAASDAHSPDDIGTAWTGVFAARRSAESIIEALNAGRSFASEASLLDFSCDGHPMGAAMQKRKGASLQLRFRAADSAGIDSVRIISQGKVVKQVEAKGRTLIESMWSCKAGAQPTYYRLESVAGDDRRAFSTPIYIVPTKP